MAVYTRDEAAEIVELFENVLDRYNIKVPSPEDDDREDDNDAKLYGSTYWDLVDLVENKLIDVIIKENSTKDPAVFGVFSGR